MTAKTARETNCTTIVVIGVIVVIGLWICWPGAQAEYVTVKYRDNGQVNIKASNFEALGKSDSTVGGAWYDTSEQYMVIKLNSTYYQYCGMPENVWNSLKEVSLLYSYYQNSIKGNYDCRINHVPAY